MKTINCYYESKNKLEDFVANHNLKSEKNVLIQVFSSNLDKKVITDIKDELVEILPNAVIIGSTTDGEILDAKVTTDEIVLSVSIFDKSTLKSAYINKDELSDYDMGASLVKSLISKKTKLIILFADGLNTNGEDFLKGIDSSQCKVMVAGGLAGDAATFSATTVFTQGYKVR